MPMIEVHIDDATARKLYVATRRSTVSALEIEEILLTGKMTVDTAEIHKATAEYGAKARGE